MSDGCAIRFDTLPWETVSAHARQKQFASEGRSVRLLELEEGFCESDWCRRSHTGYVIEGELRVQFVDDSVTLKPGDALVLLGGEAGRHKAEVNRGPVMLFLVETT